MLEFVSTEIYCSLRLVGQLDEKVPLNRHETLQKIEEEAKRSVVFDLTQVEIITSTGFSWLLGLVHDCKARNIKVAAFGMNERVAKSLKWVNAHRMMSFCEDQAQVDALFAEV